MIRSEDMNLNKIMFAKENLWDIMNFLAKSEKVMIMKKSEEKKKYLSSTE